MKQYVIIDSRCKEPTKPIQVFRTKTACKNWILSGLYGTEGAEQEHYVDLLNQLVDFKKTTLDYNWKYSDDYKLLMHKLMCVYNMVN